MTAVACSGVGRTLPDGTVALHPLTLEVRSGEFLAIVGPSGCGRTTLLRLVAGLDEVTTGELRIGGARANETAATARDVAAVFPPATLYPSMKIADAIRAGATPGSGGGDDVDARVARVVAMLGLDPLLWRMCKQVSGAERQRVALARALVRAAGVLVLDEPLGNADAATRRGLPALLAAHQRSTGATTLYATHDATEVMDAADRVVVLGAGRLLQVAPPEVVRRDPADVVVATCVSGAATTVLQVPVVGDGDTVALVVDGTAVRVEPAVAAAWPRLADRVGDEVVLVAPASAWSSAPGGGPGRALDVAACHLFDARTGGRLR